MDIDVRVHRILRKIPRFHEVSAGTSLPKYFSAHLNDGERVLGIYENASDPTIVAVTSDAIRIYRDGMERISISYVDMKDARPSDSSKQVGGVDVVLRSGMVTRVPILGGDKPRLDSFEFVRFLMRVLQDRN